MILYVVEIRERRPKGELASTVLYIASSLAKAREFIKNNTDADDRDTFWWFAIVEDCLDCAVWEPGYHGRGLFEVWSWDAQRLAVQPHSQKDMQIVQDDWDDPDLPSRLSPLLLMLFYSGPLSRTRWPFPCLRKRQAQG